MANITWIAESGEHGVRERRFDVATGDHIVPAIIWTPEGSSGPRPLVLVGHGGSRHKRVEYVLALARRMVEHHQFAVVAIDAPRHGDRADADNVPWFRLSPDVVRELTAMAVDDWMATLDAVQELEDVGVGRVGWWGLSMGTRIGVPFVAGEPRVNVAVLGLGALRRTGGRYAELAARVTVPVLYLLQLEDELMTREAGLALFDSLGSTDKRLHANPGGHTAVPREEMEASEAFLVKHLVAAPAGV